MSEPLDGEGGARRPALDPGSAPRPGQADASRLFGPARLIVNPSSGNGGVRKCLPELRAQLSRRGVEHDVVETTRRGHATELARAALADGRRYLVAVGGDGTVHEVLNGMFDGDEPIEPDAVLGVAAAGTGCDFVRTFGLDRDPAVLARHLASPHTMRIDVGKAQVHDEDGNARTRLFANIAEVGYGAEVVRLSEKLPRWLGRFRYLFAAWGAIRVLDRQQATVRVAHGERTLPLVELVVANGQFFGGAMKVAPRALPADGKFNVQAFTGQRSQVFTLTMKIYRGEHLPHPEIAEWQSPTAEVEPERTMRVEADGDLLGFTPARFSLLPAAIQLKI